MTAEKSITTEKVPEMQEDKLNPPKEEKPEKVEKTEEKYTNLIFSVLIVVTLIGSFKMFYIIEEFRNPIIEAEPSYNFPSYNDLLNVFFAIPLMGVTY